MLISYPYDKSYFIFMFSLNGQILCGITLGASISKRLYYSTYVYYLSGCRNVYYIFRVGNSFSTHGKQQWHDEMFQLFTNLRKYDRNIDFCLSDIKIKSFYFVCFLCIYTWHATSIICTFVKLYYHTLFAFEEHMGTFLYDVMYTL